MKKYAFLVCESVAILANYIYGSQAISKNEIEKKEESTLNETQKKEQIIEPITLNEMLKKIKDSPYLTEKQKKYFSNKDFLEDVLYYADPKYKKELNFIYSDYIQICYYVVDTYGGKPKEKRPPKRPFIHTHCVTARRGVLSNTFI